MAIVAPSAARRDVLEALERFGLLLKQDKRLPSVVTLVTGESLSTSWWSHPKGRLIFSVLSELADHPDVLGTKLLYSKDTFVHRSLWPSFLAVATSDASWQRRGLSTAARVLLERVAGSAVPVTASGSPVKELVGRLLVRCAEVHTESGRHEMALEPWSTWAARVGVTPMPSERDARQWLESACERIGAPLSALPWTRG